MSSEFECKIEETAPGVLCIDSEGIKFISNKGRLEIRWNQMQCVDVALGATAASSKLILELESHGTKKRIKDTLPSECHQPSSGRNRGRTYTLTYFRDIEFVARVIHDNGGMEGGKVKGSSFLAGRSGGTGHSRAPSSGSGAGVATVESSGSAPDDAQGSTPRRDGEEDEKQSDLGETLRPGQQENPEELSPSREDVRIPFLTSHPIAAALLVTGVVIMCCLSIYLCFDSISNSQNDLEEEMTRRPPTVRWNSGMGVSNSRAGEAVLPQVPLTAEISRQLHNLRAQLIGYTSIFVVGSLYFVVRFIK